MGNSQKQKSNSKHAIEKALEELRKGKKWDEIYQNSTEIIALGLPGVGKSSVLNTLFPECIPRLKVGRNTSKSTKGKPSRHEVDSKRFIVWDTEGLDGNLKEKTKSLKRFFKKDGKNIKIILYVIDLTSTRIDESVFEIYEKLGKDKLFFVILNKADKVNIAKREEMKNQLLKSTKKIRKKKSLRRIEKDNVFAFSCICKCSKRIERIDGFGNIYCDQCGNTILQYDESGYSEQSLLEDQFMKQFGLLDIINYLKFHKKEKLITHKQQSLSVCVIIAASFANGVFGLVPFPFADWPLMVICEIGMLSSLAVIWNVKFITNKNNKGIKSVFADIILSTLNIIGALIVGKITSLILKLTPLNQIGMAIDCILGAILTLILGITATLSFSFISKNIKNQPRDVSPELFKKVYMKQLNTLKKKGYLSIDSLLKYSKTIISKDRKEFDNLLNSTLLQYSKDEKEGDNILRTCECPITHKIMKNPVMVVETGSTYECSAIKEWFLNHDTDPNTGIKLSSKKNSTKLFTKIDY